jgi:hypothetical protein
VLNLRIYVKKVLDLSLRMSIKYKFNCSVTSLDPLTYMFDINLAIDETPNIHDKDSRNPQSLSIVGIELTIFSYSIY